jgi:vacuolar-type H+-ATPase subunit H
MSASQDQYISSLKKIKQVEEEAQKEIDAYASKIEDQIIQIESELQTAIQDAKSEGEKLVDSSVQEATTKASAETEKTIEEAKVKSKDITSQITQQNAQDIISILLKGVE